MFKMSDYDRDYLYEKKELVQIVSEMNKVCLKTLERADPSILDRQALLQIIEGYSKLSGLQSGGEKEE